jgi:thiamine pyrophosphate-dependent acetolactate synthase large subunit-like protein
MSSLNPPRGVSLDHNQQTERPVGVKLGAPQFGSDIAADTLRDLEIPYITLTPGASFRGLHDSLVNHLGNERPSILLCLREDHAIGIAHGYAKVTGKALAAAVHSNVGLFNAAIAIFNAWCDRMPVLVIGATGPVDAAQRRPWVDWIHTSRDQASVVRGFTKWDDQPASPVATREALMRGKWISETMPMGPVYVTLDAGVQEMKLQGLPPALDVARHVPTTATAAAPDLLRQAVELLSGARKPVILAGRVSRSRTSWDERIKLAEILSARVATDLKVAAAFPTEHPLHLGAPTAILSGEAAEAVKSADVILSIDWLDLGGSLKAACGGTIAGKIIQVSVDHGLHRGWNMDYQALPPVDLMLAADPDVVVTQLLEQLPRKRPKALSSSSPARKAPELKGANISIEQLGYALRKAIGARDACLMHTSIVWNADVWPYAGPLDYLGTNGGGGVGGGPSISVGAALALRGSERLPVAVTGDGDFLMGATALWTAVHYRIPLLIVVANNRSFFNDEMHQERTARVRGRPPENRWIGQRISEPEVDLAAIARAQGAEAFGPIRDSADLQAVYAKAIAAVDAGSVAVVDVWIEPESSATKTAEMGRGSV